MKYIRIFLFVVLALIALIVIVISFNRGGMPLGYCDPFGPGPKYVFEQRFDKCVFNVEIRCNSLGEVEDSCTNTLNSEKRKLVEKYISESDEEKLLRTKLIYLTQGGKCTLCTDSENCIFYRKLNEKIC